jgi:hypothetical protein
MAPDRIIFALVEVTKPRLRSMVVGFTEPEEESGEDGRGLDERKGELEGVDVGEEEEAGERWKGRMRLEPGTPSLTTGPWRM